MQKRPYDLKMKTQVKVRNLYNYKVILYLGRCQHLHSRTQFLSFLDQGGGQK